MQFTIVYDNYGRIRLRSGKYAFSVDEAYSIAAHLQKCSFISSVRASYFNGGLLILYDADYRDEVLAQVSGMVPGLLPLIPESDRLESLEQNSEFQFSMIVKFIRHYAFRFMVPMPIRRIVTFYKALHYFVNGVDALMHKDLNVDVLDASSIAVSMLQNEFNTASDIMFLLSISDMLESYTRKRAKLALTKSMILNVDTVWVEHDNGREEEIPFVKLQIGDKIIVRMGSTIPVDGEIISGEAFINESSLTGEAQASRKVIGDSVFAGTTIDEGYVLVKTRAIGSETRLNNIITMIDQSQDLKAGIQGKAEKLADSIVPMNFSIAGLVYLITRNVGKMASALMVDYSCAIKLSTPISIISGMREASNHRIAVKGGKYLEAFSQADTIVFDKTGTLTVAQPKVIDIISLGNLSQREVLKITACLEEHFPHSVARAIVARAKEDKVNHREEHIGVEYIVAHGIRSSLHGQQALVGSHHFIVEDEGIAVTEEQQQIIDAHSVGKSVVFLALGDKIEGMICLDDPVRSEAKQVIKRLVQLGIKNVVMLTGDGEAAAKRAAEELGIDSYHSQVLPDSKASIIEEYKAQGRKVIMVGDGVNDSPALAAANVSVAMNDASDVAREVADIAMQASELDGLITLRELSHEVFVRIDRNFKFIIGFNSLVMGLGIFGLIPSGTSSLLHNLSTMLISASSMRAYLKQQSEARFGSDPAVKALPIPASIIV